jgi:hypothetical protein
MGSSWDMNTIPVSLFRKQLSIQFGFEVKMWSGGTRRSKNLLELSTVPLPTVLYVKISNDVSGFWGLTKNQVDCLEKCGVRWFAVFLHLGPSSGYLISGNQILNRVKSGKITLSIDGDYKFNETHDFEPVQQFHDLDELIGRIR